MHFAIILRALGKAPRDTQYILSRQRFTVAKVHNTWHLQRFVPNESRYAPTPAQQASTVEPSPAL